MNIRIIRCLIIILLMAINATAQYNDQRTMVILPNLTQTQKPGEATVNPDTRAFCSDDNYVFISSSTTGRKVNHDYSAYLQFSLAAIPAGAVIDTVDLLIYLNKVKNTSSVFEQGVSLYELNNARGSQIINIADSSSTALSQVSQTDIAQAVHLQPDITDGSTWVAKRKGNFYCVLAAEEAETYRYYTERSGDRSKQPKLVITYHMPAGHARKNSWPQYKYDAQHTAMLPWQSNTTATGFKLINTFSENYIKSDPLLNEDKLVFAYQSASQPMYQLLAMSQGGYRLTQASTEALVKYGPIADRNSNIYCMTGNAASTLAVLNPDKLQFICNKQLENNAQAVAAPITGFDGSIYISTNQGVYAYTPQPECKLKWIYTANGNKFGIPALSETEQALYVYDGTSGNITALNTIDGLIKWQTPLKTSFTTDIPVPSVKNNRLCITTGLRKGNAFYIIDTRDGQLLQTVKTGPEVLSQPVIGAGKAFIINNGQVEAYALSNGAKESATATKNLNPASALVIDANDNLYALSTEQGKQSLTMVAPGATTFPTLPIEDAKGLLAGNRLLLAPDGTLVTGNDNHLYTISPTGFALKDNITIPLNNSNDFKSEYLYRTEGTVNVAGKTITGNQNIVIQAGKGIILQSGFSVRMGATLHCKTGL
ncbi:outer membrane protein assembly factor BamB family protein [Chitinophaga agrisoli]|nr:PQQ-binding-like beta-propeller repeat protein [Chitinophaga agrisoli]